MKAPTHSDILAALAARSEWEERQATWYKMRHDGLRRINKPWKNAADMHFPLADMLIEKLKPSYIGQIFATDTVASFRAQSDQWTAHQTTAAQWLDYQLKQRTNFEGEIMVAVDTMLQTGKAIVKVYWDVVRREARFESVNPLHIIVPAWTGKLADADWIVHVQTYSRAAYERLPGFDTAPETIEQLVGARSKTGSSHDAAKYQREGITHAKTGEEVVVWELAYRGEGGQWRIKTFSPARPEKELRPEFGLPYAKGVFSEAIPPPPYAEINAEAKGRDYYSPRGVCERVMPFEVSLCKDWNTIKDHQSLTSAPVFSAGAGVPQNANLRMIPGQILPFALQAVQFPPIPVDIGQSMAGTRAVAEQLIAIPDAGVRSEVPGRDTRTAAEVNLLGSLAGRSDDLRARVFRMELTHLLNLTWGILLQYAPDQLDYFTGAVNAQLPPEALAGSYRIEPNGSGDNYNRGLVLQRAIARKQMFTGNPNIDQRELDRSVLESDDARLVHRLLLNEGSAQAQQLEDQAQELSIMLIGYPAEVRPTDDDWAHLQALAGFVQRRAQTGEPLTPEMLMLLAQHAEAHRQALSKKNPALSKEHGPQVKQLIATLQSEAQRTQQAVQAAQQQAQAADGFAAQVLPGTIPFPVGGAQ